MKLWQKILVGIGVLVLAFLGVAMTQPDTFKVERSTEIAAPAEKSYALVADFHEWAKWSPWEKLDASMKKTFSGAPTGVGQVYEWEGNKDVGKGRMTLTAADPGKLVGIKLEFLEPFAANNALRFEFAAAGDRTTVHWIMEGESKGLLIKAMHLVMPMDSMVGGDFERGLAAMKTAAEGK